MPEEVVVPRGDGGVTGEDIQALLEARLQGILEQAATSPREELAEPLFWWEVFAIGPIQPGALTVPPADLVDQPLLPHRIIQVGETASIFTVVFVNPYFPHPSLSACDIMTGFNAKIELNYVTSNLQTMTPAPGLSGSSCVRLKRNVCVYVDRFDFTARTPACLYETNICARVCNCSNQPIQPFGAFVRWVFDLDFDLFFGSKTPGFDRPIRFMVSDLNSPCAACE
jgi:hypothetical protein